MEKNNLEKFCSFLCEHSNSKKSGYAACYSQNIVYCEKYNTERNKGSLCLDYNK